MTSLILLCAGLSSRFGGPKALADFEGQTVLERLQGLLVASVLNEIVVVLGARAEDIKPYVLNHTKVKVVYNKDYKFGQTSSFKAGLKAVDPSSGGIAILPVDFPLIRRETIDDLVTAFLKDRPAVLIPVFQGRKGHPPFFAAQFKKEFLGLPDEEGINTVFHRHAGETVLREMADRGVIAGFNTPEELAQLKNISQSG